MKKTYLIFLTFILLPFSFPSRALADEMTKECVDKAIGPGSDQAVLNIDKAILIHSEGDHHLIAAGSSQSPGRMTKIVIKDCKALLVDGPGHGIEFNNFVSADAAERFSQRSLDFSRSMLNSSQQ